MALNLDIDKTRPTPQSNGGLVLGFRVSGFGFTVYGFGLWTYGLGFRANLGASLLLLSSALGVTISIRLPEYKKP